tara:strand:- start:59 stop:379 length:321 start_codon:yes stop_codon:yes gene_type:complete
MKKFNLKDMIGGWFVGDFEPTIIKTDKAEVAIKKYKKGHYEKLHHHKLADEVTVLVSGKAKMNDEIVFSNDIILIEKNENTDFTALEDCVTVVFKTGSFENDKYID